MGAVEVLDIDGGDFLNILKTGTNGHFDWMRRYQSCMHALLIPNLAGHRVTVLESKRYFGADRADYVDGGYYR